MNVQKLLSKGWGNFIAISKSWTNIRTIDNEYINLPSVYGQVKNAIRPFWKSHNINSWHYFLLNSINS